MNEVKGDIDNNELYVDTYIQPKKTAGTEAYVRWENKQIIDWKLPNGFTVEVVSEEDPRCPVKGKMLIDPPMLKVYMREDECAWVLQYLRSLMAKEFPLILQEKTV